VKAASGQARRVVPIRQIARSAPGWMQMGGARIGLFNSRTTNSFSKSNFARVIMHATGVASIFSPAIGLMFHFLLHVCTQAFALTTTVF
jgi:hypothetical protein